MIEQIKLIAERHGIAEPALRELIQLIQEFESAAPRVPTQRASAEGSSHVAPEPPIPMSADDFKRRYQFIRTIGRGGFSEVREVYDGYVGRLVALKQQLPERSSADDCLLFRREIRITAQLQHPGVVPLHDWGELPDGRIWFTMKRVHGRPLADRIAELHRLAGPEFVQALRRLLEAFRRLCEPVAYAHSQRIIHRDISPANMMIGDLGEVHMMDWGLARDLKEAPSAARSGGEAASEPDPSDAIMRTRIMGTPYYMSPEQARGEPIAMRPSSDVYALGAILYEILSGRAPYVPVAEGHEVHGEILARVREEAPEPISEHARRETPKELFELCIKAMHRQPEDRYPDAQALITALTDWLDGADRTERAMRIVADAESEHGPRIKEMRAEATMLRSRAREILGRLRQFDDATKKAEGWRLEDAAAALEQRSMREEIYWTQKLRSALNEAPDLEQAHAALAKYYEESLRRAEEEHDEPATMRFTAMLEDHSERLSSDAERQYYASLLRGNGRLTILTEPPGAEVILRRYELSDRYLTSDGDDSRTERSPVRALALPRGAYLAIITAPGYRAVRYPLLIEREHHWDGVRPGEAGPAPIRLLREEELGPNDVYIPAGWFIAGGDRRAGESLPRRRIWVDDFIIRRHPVTNAEYVEFLNALAADGGAAEAHQFCPRQHPGATINDEAALAYLYDEAERRYALKDPETEGSMPVVFVDWHAATAYAAHTARSTGRAWRLPSELEWEKAARGVDGRFMPWGDYIEPTWACLAGSHNERKRLMSVHRYPTDASPYGVRGMAGNARDWCIERWDLDGPRVEGGVLRIEPALPSDGGYRSLRGGAWSSVSDMARLAVRYAEHPDQRHGVLGFRLARSL